MEFVYLKWPASPTLAQWAPRLHAALQAALDGDGLGSLVGWGASIDDSDGHQAFHRVDIEVARLDEAVARLKGALQALEAPPHTELHYQRHGRPWQEAWLGQAWLAGTPRVPPHPPRGLR